jgi:hypothetical protein
MISVLKKLVPGGSGKDGGQQNSHEKGPVPHSRLYQSLMVNTNEYLHNWVSDSIQIIARAPILTVSTSTKKQPAGFGLAKDASEEHGMSVSVEVDRKINPGFSMDGVWESMKTSVKTAYFYGTNRRNHSNMPCQNTESDTVKICEDYEAGNNLTVCFWVVPQQERSLVICAQRQDNHDKASARLTILDINYGDIHAIKYIPLYKCLYGLIENNEKFVKLRGYMNGRRDSSEMESFHGLGKPQTVRPRAVFGCAACGKLIVNG